MASLARSLIFKSPFLRLTRSNPVPKRTFLSPAYYCNETWESRLSSPLLQKVNLDLLFYELDQRFQNSRQISAVDVDIFANAVKDDTYIDELLDLVHKLRLTAETGNALESTGHAAIRTLLKHNKIEDLLNAIDDRINYGIFLDNYTANLLMDVFWKSKDYLSGARVAQQLMLQEDFSHPVSTVFALLHCYNYLLNPLEWPKPKPPEEPEVDVKVRVKYLRNPYFDNHFDLTDGSKIVGKTLMAVSKNKDDPLNRSFYALGSILFGNDISLKDCIAYCRKNNISLIKKIIDLVPSDNELKTNIDSVKVESMNVQEILEKQMKEQIAKTSESDIASQCKLYKKWEAQRIEALEEQKKRIDIANRLAEIENIKENLRVKEQKLWFFEKEEDIELTIESNLVQEEIAEQKPKKNKKNIKDEDYVPPEVKARRTDSN